MSQLHRTFSQVLFIAGTRLLLKVSTSNSATKHFTNILIINGVSGESNEQHLFCFQGLAVCTKFVFKYSECITGPGVGKRGKTYMNKDSKNGKGSNT